MEIIFYLILVCYLLAIIFRCVFFKTHQQSIIKALIPGYNKYILGKLSNNKVAGIVEAISSVGMHTAFFVYVWILYDVITNHSYVTTTSSGTYATVLDNLSSTMTDMISLTPIIWCAFGAVSFIAWFFLMRSFLKINEKSSWFIFLWLICPAIAYCYFGIIDKKMYIPEKGIVTRKATVSYE